MSSVRLSSILTLLLCCSGCTDGSAPSRSPAVAPSLTFTENACPMTIPDGFEEADFRCGTADIPLDWSDPNSETITMAVAVLKARSEPTAVPLVFLGGGPGIPNLDGYLQRTAAHLAPLNEERDIVFFDPRGVGRSTPRLSCPETVDSFLTSYQSPLTSAEDGQAQLDGYRDCYERLTAEGVDPSHHDSAAVVRDLAALMEALGEDSYDLYGLSYGGREAQTMLRDRPDAVRRVILDATIMPDISNTALWPRNFEGALDALFAACEQSPECSAEHPDLSSALTTAVATLNDTPHVTAVPTDDGPLEVHITGDRFLAGLHSALYQRSYIGLLPLVITSVADGSYGLIDAFAPDLVPDLEDIDRGAYASMLCAETIPYDDLATVQAAKAGVDPDIARALGGINGDMLIELCDDWTVERSAADERAPIHSDKPVLVLGDTFDPASPPSYSDRAVDNLSQAQLVRTEGLGHGVFRNAPVDEAGSSCALDIGLMFLDSPSAEIDISCVDAIPPPF